jgi:F420-dependent oxidoreductase-like protein
MLYTGIMTLTRFGFNIPSFTYLGIDDADLFNAVCAAAATAENSGFDSLWVMDHFHQIPPMGADHEPMLEPYTLLAALAPWTRTARLGALVTGVTYRNPAMLAKTVTTLDVVSGGRAVFGIGAAWFEAEHIAYGYDFPPVGERMRRLEDTVQICRAMFSGGPATVAGTHHHVSGALNRPRPITPGGPPILVGGSGERRTLQIVARHADACNIVGDPAGVRHKLDVLEAHCEQAGRDPAEISKTRLGALVIGDTTADAARLGAELRARRNMSMEKYRGYVIEGDRDSVCEQVAALFDAGLDGLIFNVHDATDLGFIAEAGTLLRDNFGDQSSE